MVRGWTTKHGNEVGLAVNDTVRTLGVLSVPAPGDVGAEYTLAAYTGADYPFPVSSINGLQILDGASDGLHNYASRLAILRLAMPGLASIEASRSISTSAGDPPAGPRTGLRRKWCARGSQEDRRDEHF